MKKYIMCSEVKQTICYNEKLGERFIAYCKNANFPNAEIWAVPEYDFKFITGVPTSKLHKMVNSFVKALEKSGETIIFELSTEDNWPNKIIKLCFDI